MAAFLTLAFIPANAEKKLPKVSFTAGPTATWNGESLELSFTATMNGPKHGDLQLQLIPYYILGNDSVSYPSIIFSTKSGARYAKRRSYIEGTVDKETRTVKMHNGKATTSYDESRLIPASDEGKLFIRKMLSTCCDAFPVGEIAVNIPSRTITPDTVKIIEYVPVVKEKTFETVKSEREAYLDLHIKYPVSKHDVLPDFNGNAAELKRLDDLLAPMLREKDTYRIIKIVVTGHTSPEGTYGFNQQLSVKRAESMRSYIKTHYPQLQTVGVEAQGMGEDWDGLLDMIRGNGMDWENQAISIIEKNNVMDGREQKLMMLQSGKPYRYMLDNYFPQLRRIGLKIIYKVIESETIEK